MNTLALISATFVLQAASCYGFTIVLTPAPGMDAMAQSGFRYAANFWESKFSDDVTMNLNIGYSALDPGVLGQAGSNQISATFGSVRTALIDDATSASDSVANAHLPGSTGGQSFSFFTQKNTESGSTTSSLDNDTIGTRSNNNRFLDITTANAKALGWVAPDPTASDASITFSSLFNWDFDQRDGVGAGLQDFVGVAIHEIGHAMGFISGVDTVDYYISHPLDLDPYAVFSTLDLFRYSAPNKLDLAAGSASYFSIDGGAINLGAFSTGTIHGDGRQASHWKDNLGLGIMDPTANPAGQINIASPLDILAFDVIGWDVKISAVPEPGQFLPLGFLLGLAGLIVRKRN